MTAGPDRHVAPGQDVPGADAFEAKHARLRALLREFGSVCVGYSGGVDSTFLAWVAVDTLGAGSVLAVTGLSDAYPRIQRTMAEECATRFGIPHLEIDTDELADADYVANRTNRCYFCKTELWTRLHDVADQRGMAVVVDGSNADDAGDFRPGLRAARERGVRSPLLEVGLTKAQVRALSRAAGLPTWDRPASPCLSSRLPYGLAVTPQRLHQVEVAEDVMRGLGFREFRVRHHGDVARVEVVAADLDRALDCAAALDAALRQLGFRRVLLDVDGFRSGALNEGLGLVQLAAPA